MHNGAVPALSIHVIVRYAHSAPVRKLYYPRSELKPRGTERCVRLLIK